MRIITFLLRLISGVLWTAGAVLLLPGLTVFSIAGTVGYGVRKMEKGGCDE